MGDLVSYRNLFVWYKTYLPFAWMDGIWVCAKCVTRFLRIWVLNKKTFRLNCERKKILCFFYHLYVHSKKIFGTTLHIESSVLFCIYRMYLNETYKILVLKTIFFICSVFCLWVRLILMLLHRDYERRRNERWIVVYILLSFDEDEDENDEEYV